MCLISKYLHCLELRVYCINKTYDRSFIYVSIIYKVCFSLLYTFSLNKIYI
jgi:hypothetical protein